MSSNLHILITELSFSPLLYSRRQTCLFIIRCSRAPYHRFKYTVLHDHRHVVLWYELPACHYLSLFYHIIHRHVQVFGYFYACVQPGNYPVSTWQDRLLIPGEGQAWARIMLPCTPGMFLPNNQQSYQDTHREINLWRILIRKIFMFSDCLDAS